MAKDKKKKKKKDKESEVYTFANIITQKAQEATDGQSSGSQLFSTMSYAAESSGAKKSGKKSQTTQQGVSLGESIDRSKDKLFIGTIKPQQ